MKVVLLGRMPCAGLSGFEARLSDRHEVAAVREPQDAENRIGEFESADVIVGGPVDRRIVGAASRLKLFHVFRGGIDGLGVELLPNHVAVANTFHHEAGVAEFAVLSCLLLPRRIYEYDRRLRRGDWSGSVMWGEPPEYATLQGTRVLLVGAGHIGTEIAARLRAFGPRIVAVSRDPKRAIPHVDEVVGYDSLHLELGRADFVILSVRLADNTAGLIGAPELEKMKDSAYLINVSRGAVVDQHALYDALAAGGIAGAAVDVWYTYPTTREETCLPSEAKLYELDNLIMSPNRSSWTETMLDGRVQDVAENVERLAADRPLTNVVHRGRYGEGGWQHGDQ